MVQEQNDGLVNKDVSFHPESIEKCGVSNDTRLYNISMDGKLPSSLTIKSHTKGRKLNLEDNCQASNSIPRVVFLKEFQAKKAISNADSLDLTGAPISPEETSEVLSASGPSTSSIEDPRHFMRNSSRVSGNSSVNMQFMKDPVKEKFICDVCHKEYDHKSVLATHYRKHTGEKPFVCDVCKKTFTRKGHLESHRVTHTGQKPFVCDVCKKAFSRKTDLERHGVTHTGKQPFVCDVCKKAFNRKDCLERHRVTHTGEKPFVCDVCKKTFTRKEHLESHRVKHTIEKSFGSDV